MQVLSDAIVINLSASQKKLLRSSGSSAHVEGLLACLDGSRLKIQIDQAAAAVAALKKLQATAVIDPNKPGHNPAAVVDQLLLKLTDAIAAQRRTYGQNNP